MKDGYPEQQDLDFLKNLSIDNFIFDIYSIVDLFNQSEYGNATISQKNISPAITMPILCVSTGG